MSEANLPVAPCGVIRMPGALSLKQQQRFREAWQRACTGTRGQVVILEEGFSLIPFVEPVATKPRWLGSERAPLPSEEARGSTNSVKGMRDGSVRHG